MGLEISRNYEKQKMRDFLREVLIPESERWFSGVESHGHFSQNQGESRLRSVIYMNQPV